MKKKSSSRSTEELKKTVTHLGSQKTKYKDIYAPEVLEVFTNKNPKNDQWVTFICPEFTSLCPLTGQPDFAKIFINYIPDQLMVESKALKLYLFSFRNHGDFHEDCVQKICNDLSALMAPRYLEVIGEFTPRGGIAIFPYSQFSQKKYHSLGKTRLENYSPGRYTMELGKPY